MPSLAYGSISAPFECPGHSRALSEGCSLSADKGEMPDKRPLVVPWHASLYEQPGLPQNAVWLHHCACVVCSQVWDSGGSLVPVCVCVAPVPIGDYVASAGCRGHLG